MLLLVQVFGHASSSVNLKDKQHVTISFQTMAITM